MNCNHYCRKGCKIPLPSLLAHIPPPGSPSDESFISSPYFHQDLGVKAIIRTRRNLVKIPSVSLPSSLRVHNWRDSARTCKGRDTP
ncbi:hypothetical protein J6590_004343 [Homalodisca vitripennis]|nr:hypothetical protein J6590_004343 [Homalodisca vitripennis]